MERWKTYQGNDNLTIRVGFELVRWDLRTELHVVVYLPVNSKDTFSIVADERLSTGF